MMFCGFEKEMIDFFWELKFNNQRPWFQEHKEVYVKQIYEPMKELAAEVCKGMKERCELETLWKCSRIYRDARRPHPDGPYRNCIWFVLSQREHWSDCPTFFAEISGEGLRYGMGSYCSTAEFMKRVRAKMDASPAEIDRLVTEFEKNTAFHLEGAMYRRPKGHLSEHLDPWYNRKNISFMAFEPWSEQNMGSTLSEYLVEKFEPLVPIYRWLWQCVPEEE